jgi:hypothetical protein
MPDPLSDGPQTHRGISTQPPAWCQIPPALAIGAIGIAIFSTFEWTVLPLAVSGVFVSISLLMLVLRLSRYLMHVEPQYYSSQLRETFDGHGSRDRHAGHQGP